MKNTQLANLKEGQPITFRYSGQTENGARGNKAIYGMLTASEALSKLLRDNPEEFLRIYRGSSEQVNNFLKASIGHWSQNSHEGEFDRWYKNSSPEVKLFLQELRLKVQPIEQRGGQHYVTETHSFGELPVDLHLPELIRKQIDENSRRIDEDKGWESGKLGVIKTSTPAGYVDAFTFGLGDWHSWSTFGGLVLDDPNYAYQVTPITRDALLSGLQTEMENYRDLIVKGGLEGAIEARKQFLLAKVYQKLQAAESNEQIHQIMGSDNRFPAPETGVYVLIGANGEGPKLSAVRVNPRYDEDKVAGLMGVLTATERGFETLRFQALEVPEVALKYIQNLKILEVRLS